jgi:hypothetical protein
LRAELFALGAVVGEETQADGTISLQVKVEQHKLDRLGKRLLGSSVLTAAVVARSNLVRIET